MTLHHDPDHDEAKSKSQRKREADALQELGEALLRFTPAELERVDLPAALLDALLAAQRIHQRSAHKRQLQYIGKLMRSIDPEPVRHALDRLTEHDRQSTAELHRIERWRERLLEEGDAALGELVDAHPDADRQHLRQLVRSAQREHLANRPPTSARALFRYLRELMHEGD
ncbi:MAG TPA: ribosome biogenesis factor YjgA [Gammaproteobacteria bacterium]|nr:ribosome biogenesis factor YjgA [Gammaproteobacteria bacterium]